MYSDYEPCRVCGSEVELRQPQNLGVNEPDGPTDERVCVNQSCATNASGATQRP